MVTSCNCECNADADADEDEYEDADALEEFKMKRGSTGKTREEGMARGASKATHAVTIATEGSSRSSCAFERLRDTDRVNQVDQNFL